MSEPAFCGCPTRVEGKFRTCERQKGHEGDHETTYCGKDFRWSNPTMTTPTKGAMSAAKELFPRVKFRSQSHEGIARIIDAHTHAAELEFFVREVSEWNGDTPTCNYQYIISVLAEKARALLANLEGGK